MASITRENYASLYGPTKGDRVRLADTDLIIEIEEDRTVYGDEVELSGSIEGKIEAKKVVLNGTARMTGDILHQDIKIESGAFISGNLKPEYGKSDSKPTLKPVASNSSANVSPLSAAAPK